MPNSISCLLISFFLSLLHARASPQEDIKSELPLSKLKLYLAVLGLKVFPCKGKEEKFKPPFHLAVVAKSSTQNQNKLRQYYSQRNM